MTLPEPVEPTRSLTRRDARTLVLAALGGVLEYYDFIIFVFFVAVIGRLFFPPDTPEWLRQLQTFGLFAAGYLARPLGGIVMAHFGDRRGRKRMFLLSVFLMALPTLAIGLLPTYASIGYAAPLALLCLRILQGAAVGGEVPGAWTFVAEHVPEHRTGFACGTLTAGLTVGILVGSLIATAVNTAYSPAEVEAFAWRIPFLIGGVFGVFAVYLRRWLAETPVFEDLQRRKLLVEGLPLKTVLRGHGAAVAMSMLLTWVLSAAIVVVILMTPTFAEQLHAIAPAAALRANSVATLCLAFGCIIAGRAADRFGAARAFGIGCLALLIATLGLYYGSAMRTDAFAVLYAIAGLCVGVVAIVPVLLVQAFPPAIRYTGISFAYNIAYALFGGLTPLVVSWWVRSDAMAPAKYVAALCLLGVVVAIWLERSGRDRVPASIAGPASGRIATRRWNRRPMT
ncbi:MAG TPA: MFS transporter [Rhodanobacteraceae bacterium]|nr:MFS transporter [Rhodanobacteraceae bacterium]